jgi:hypothetical protein
MSILSKTPNLLRVAALAATGVGAAAREGQGPTDPKALRSRARAEADEVRAMAYAYRHDPSFASELYAAADRHEQLADESGAVTAA